MEFVTLNNGIIMPQMGYGVYQVTPEECERCVSDALSVGYRMIDTAQAYHNEEGVGQAIKKAALTGMSSSLSARCGFQTMATSVRKPPSTRVCVNCKRITST